MVNKYGTIKDYYDGVRAKVGIKTGTTANACGIGDYY